MVGNIEEVIVESTETEKEVAMKTKNAVDMMTEIVKVEEKIVGKDVIENLELIAKKLLLERKLKL